MQNLLWVASVLVLPCVAWPQEAPEVTAGNSKEVLEILKGLDSRIYAAEDRGLNALSFTYRPGGSAELMSDFRVRHRWRKGVGDAVDFLDNDGKASEMPPCQEAHRAELREFYVATSRQLADVLRGKTFMERYAGFRGRVVRHVVNRREERTLVLEPKNPERVRRILIHLDRNALPTHWEFEYLAGDRREERRKYESRDDGVWILTSRQEIYTPADSTARGYSQAFVATYQKIGGYYLAATLRKARPGVPEGAQGTTSLNEVMVDTDVPEFTPK